MFLKQVRTCLGLAMVMGAGCSQAATEQPDAPLKPTAEFEIAPRVFERCPFALINTSTNADSFQWRFGETASPQGSKEKEPLVYFPWAGDESISLIATSAGGTASAQRAVTVRQAASYSLLDHNYVDGTANDVAILPSGDSVAIEYGEIAGPQGTTHISKLVTRSRTGGVVGEKANTFANRIWGTLSNGSILVQGFDQVTSTTTLGAMPPSLAEPTSWYPGHPKYKTSIRDVKIVADIAYIAGLAQVATDTWQPFVQRRDTKNGDLLSFTLWGTPTINPVYFGRIAVSPAGIFATTGIQRQASFDVDVTLARFDHQSGDFIGAVASYVRPMLGARSNWSNMAVINDKVVISDGVGTYAVTTSGQPIPFPNQLPQSAFLVTSDGSLVAVGTNGPTVVMRRYDSELNILAEGRTAPAAPEVRVYDAAAIAEGHDCGIVAAGRQSLGSSVVDFAPAYIRFSANGKL